MKVELVYERVGGAAPGVNRFVCPELEMESLGGSVSGRIWFKDPLGTNAAGLLVTVQELSAEQLAAMKSPEVVRAPESVPAEAATPSHAPPAAPGEEVAPGSGEGDAPPDVVTPPPPEGADAPPPEGSSPA